ncbi:MAG: SoxR reducing system RseC family protein [Bacteroidales bacterium]|nr:SoxR reducing system RseC family protein [Bacteroidales bacterium]
MEASVCIMQKGTVENVKDNLVKVRIQRDTVCGHCHARGFCEMGSQHDTLIESSDFTDGLKTGDYVEVKMEQRQGNMAVMLAYLGPFVLLMTLLLIMEAAGAREWVAGLVAITSLVPYFLFLYFFRKKIKRTFSFSVRKTEA